jgi:hydrogenase expression/formation protein HypC
MCLAVPMEVLEIDGDNVKVGLWGVTREARLDVLDERPKIGDYVIVHAGFAIHLIDPEEARYTIDLFEQAGLHHETLE